jgi:molybdopterin synthase sulfur carrier subunit
VGRVKVHLPKLLASYTGDAREVEAEGETLAEVLEDLDRRFPGLRFRIVDEQDGLRPHIRFFVNREQVRGLDVSLETGDQVHIFQALSGGLL